MALLFITLVTIIIQQYIIRQYTTVYIVSRSVPIDILYWIVYYCYGGHDDFRGILLLLSIRNNTIQLYFYRLSSCVV